MESQGENNNPTKILLETKKHIIKRNIYIYWCNFDEINAIKMYKSKLYILYMANQKKNK